MCNFFAPVITLVSIFFATPIFGLTTIGFDNNYAIFRPADKGLAFDLEDEAEILFLAQLENPSLENSPFGLRIKREGSEDDLLLHFTLHKEGIVSNHEKYDIEDVSSLMNMQLAWDMSGNPSIQISVKNAKFRSTAFSWTDDRDDSLPTNITHVAFKTSGSMTIRQRDSFLWITDLSSACPLPDAVISCELNVNRPRLISTNDNNNNNNNSNNDIKGLRRIMEMKLIPRQSSTQQNYELVMASNQTSDKAAPRLHVIHRNVTKLKMDTIIGSLTLDVNISSGNIVLRKKNATMPFLSWNDPVTSNGNRAFPDIRYATVEVSESAASRSQYQGADKPINACKVICKTIEVSWYTRWMQKFKSVFTGNDTSKSRS